MPGHRLIDRAKQVTPTVRTTQKNSEEERKACKATKPTSDGVMDWQLALAPTWATYQGASSAILEQLELNRRSGGECWSPPMRCLCGAPVDQHHAYFGSLFKLRYGTVGLDTVSVLL